MADYHKYVFDTDKRKFVGDFEAMYQAEQTEGFDSWHQDDTRQLQRRIDSLLISQYNFDCILDLGCGKGTFTHTFKQKNNHVIGVDLSETAIAVAKSRYPDIQFEVADLSTPEKLRSLYTTIQDQHGTAPDLTFCSEVLSYLDEWPALLEVMAKHSRYVLISLYIPDNPIGYVKSSEQLVEEFTRVLNPIEIIEMKTSRFTIALGESHE